MDKVNNFINGEIYSIQGKPVWGPHYFNLEDYSELIDKLLKYITMMAREGGVLIIPFEEGMERSLLIFLNILAGKLLQIGKKITFTKFFYDPYLEFSEDNIDIWFIHQASLFNNLTYAIETWLRPGKIAIITGISETWEQNHIHFPSIWIKEFDQELNLEEEEKGVLAEINSKLKENTLKKTFRYVALCDAWGVPLPFDLLSRLLQIDGDDLALLIDNNILFWVEREKPYALFVATRSERYSKRYLLNLTKEERDNAINFYKTILTSIDIKNREERFTVLKLVQSWLANSNFRFKVFNETFGINQIRDFIRENWNWIKSVCISGNASEQLVWGHCLMEMELYNFSLEIFEESLKKYQDNQYLLQAKAHLLSRWGAIDPEKQELASAAFLDALRRIENNVYLWQAAGVFEAERGNPKEAERYFEEGLKVAQVPKQKVCILVARADMNLESGLYDKAKKDIEMAKKFDEDNLYVKHLEGRLYFTQGRWANAEKKWKEILTTKKQNIYALQSLGHMFRELGLWDKSKDYLERALNYDPENVPVLQEKGLLEKDQGFLEESEKTLLRALSLSPENPKTIVALAVVERLQNKIEEAEGRLQRLLRIWPDNLHALHVLALCYLQRGEKEKALQQIQEIINKSLGSNLPAYIFLVEMAIDYDKDVKMAENLMRRAMEVYDNLSSYLPVHKKIEFYIEKARLLKKMEKITEEEKSRLKEALKSLDPEGWSEKIRVSLPTLGV